MNPKVSIVLPIYNGEKTLARTLDSLANQSYKDFELVACIDGTNDGSLKILEDYKDRFKSLSILINEKNLGLGPTMNRLVANANGEFIAVAEQDDVYVSDRLALQVEVLNENSEIGMCSGIAEHFNYHKNKTTFRFPGVLVHNKEYPTDASAFFLWNYIEGVKVANSCMMFRKSVHVDNGLYFSKHLGSVSVDWLYVLRFVLVSKIKGISRTLVILDRTPSQLNVTSNKIRMFESSFELLRSIRFEYPDLVTPEVYKKALVFQHRMKYAHYSLFSKCLHLFSIPFDFNFKLNYLLKKARLKFKR